MLRRKKEKIMENLIKSLSISVNDLTSQVDLLRNELRELKNELNTKDLKVKKQTKRVNEP